MAKIKGNVIMKGVRGMLNKQVIVKERLGTEYMCYSPQYNDNRHVPEDELKNRDLFRENSKRAVALINNAELKSLYDTFRKKGQTAYNVAMSDVSHPPKIKALYTQGYTGKSGGTIIIHATDNIKVTRVSISIYDETSQLIEQGDALDNDDSLTWLFAAKIENSHVQGCTIEAKAYDIAQNETTLSIVIE